MCFTGRSLLLGVWSSWEIDRSPPVVITFTVGSGDFRGVRKPVLHHGRAYDMQRTDVGRSSLPDAYGHCSPRYVFTLRSIILWVSRYSLVFSCRSFFRFNTFFVGVETLLPSMS